MTTTIPEKCVTAKNHSQIVFGEKRSKITFENPTAAQYLAIKVDGCVFNEQDGRKCDLLLQSIEHGDQYFVELKGSDTSSAVEQLNDTIDRIPPSKSNASRMAFAVFSNRCPKNDSTRQAIEKRFYKKGVKLSFCSTGTTYKLSR